MEGIMLVKDITTTTSPSCVSDLVGRIKNIDWVWLQAKEANTVNILWGNADTQIMELLPGGSVILPFSDINVIYVKAASGTAGLNITVRSL
jgi:hypothetical protein